jgi:uncharacterized protein
MFQKSLIVLAVALACSVAGAQQTPAAPSAPAAASSPAKKELVSRIIKLQQGGIEAMAMDLVKQPAAELLTQAGEYLQTQVPADKREAIAKGMQADGDKYMNEVYPVVRGRALQLAPATVGALLEEKFTEDELKQVVAIMESPVYAKFQSLGGDMQRALLSKLVPEVRPQIGPKLRALDESLAKRLGVNPAMGAPGAGARPAASGARAPAKKP